MGWQALYFSVSNGEGLVNPSHPFSPLPSGPRGLDRTEWEWCEGARYARYGLVSLCSPRIRDVARSFRDTDRSVREMRDRDRGEGARHRSRAPFFLTPSITAGGGGERDVGKGPLVTHSGERNRRSWFTLGSLPRGPLHSRALPTHPLPTPRFTRRKGLTSPPHQLHSRGSLAGGPFLVITLLVRGPFGPRGVERDSEGLVTSVPLETLATHPATKGKGNVGRDRSLSSFIPVPSTPNRRQESKVLVGWIGLSARTSPHSLCSFAASHSVALERVYYPTSVTMEGRPLGLVSYILLSRRDLSLRSSEDDRMRKLDHFHNLILYP